MRLAFGVVIEVGEGVEDVMTVADGDGMVKGVDVGDSTASVVAEATVALGVGEEFLFERPIK